MNTHKIICDDCIKQLKQFEDNSIDSCVTDPPYGLDFMGKEWDTFNPLSFQQFTHQWGTELYRILKPGAHILVFGGTRTYHRMACGIEDAGFEVRDMIEWFYGGGFPKSLDVSKQLDKINGEERDVIGVRSEYAARACKSNFNQFSSIKPSKQGINTPEFQKHMGEITIPTSEQAIQWDGWGTGLKPAHEPILLARKPISEHNIAGNVVKWGTGGINIDKCRICTNENTGRKCGKMQFLNMMENDGDLITTKHQQGRFPANLILGCCCEEDELVEGIVNSGGGEKTIMEGITSIKHHGKAFNYGDEKGIEKCVIHTNPNCMCEIIDEVSGDAKSGASRFFYQPKASASERWFYCKLCERAYQIKNRDKHIHNAPTETRYNHLEFHPTQKPTQLIQYLIRLITPPNGTILDPFLGSGTALVAAEREKLNCTGIDNNQIYCNIANQRIKEELKQTNLFEGKSNIIIK